MKKTLASLFLTGLFLTACSGGTVTPAQTKPSEPAKTADQVLDNNIFAQATGSGNLARCKDIVDNTMKASCEQIINDNTATNAALSALDKSLCSKVSNERYKKDCETQVDTKLVIKNADSDKLSLEQNAIDKADPGLCNKISDTTQKASCKYNILTDLAMQKKDPSICEGIGLQSMIDICKSSFQKISK